ncbi:NAD(P)-binding protein [Heliocybe sulcata]|uniref:NAD(P)-binding protein n=1 Tax=Heliocybe sulcata TaxID=5364 RepID=A0A5C3N634_9AGAM|nr:NAD(P)-binding protein [Heliocybe sulcata]
MSSPRIALVTGGAQGMGRSIALRLARDGLDVAVSDLPSQKALLEEVANEIKALGSRSLAVFADVSREDEVNSMVQAVVQELGGLDVMVANAGIAAFRSVLDTTTEELDRVYSVNVKGVLLCYKAAAGVMIEQKRGGRIIGASSILGKKGWPMWASYGSSKFAVRALTQVAACEFGPYGITVNAYAPGGIDTPLLRVTDKEVAERTNVPEGTHLNNLTAQTALGRLGQTEDVANVVSFLASKDSAYMTGQTLAVDGGVWFD